MVLWLHPLQVFKLHIASSLCSNKESAFSNLVMLAVCMAPQSPEQFSAEALMELPK